MSGSNLATAWRTLPRRLVRRTASRVSPRQLERNAVRRGALSLSSLIPSISARR